MKNSIKNVCVCSIIIGLIAIAEAQSGNILLAKYNKKEGQTLAFYADNGTLSKCPKWNGEDNIPLLPQKAVSIAKEWLLRRTQDKETPSVDSLTIQTASRVENCWFYTVFFTTLNRDNKGSVVPLNNAVVVLFDGTVVEPIVEKENILSTNVKSEVQSNNSTNAK